MLRLLLPPDPPLAPLLHACAVVDLPGGPYRLPAALHPLLLVVLDGEIRYRTALTAPEQALPRLALSGPTTATREARARAGTRILTASLRPGALAALFGIGADMLLDRLLALDTLLPGALLTPLQDQLEAPAASPHRAVAAVQAMLLAALRREPPRHRPLLLPPAWRTLPVDEIARRCGLGPRQFERRFAHSHGQPLRSYRRQLRCSAVLIDAICGRGRPDAWAGIALDAGYSDQAHFSRDLVRYTGHTPTALRRGIAAADPALWPYRYAASELRALFGPDGY